MLPMTFEEFRDLCDVAGYVGNEQPKYNLFYLRTKNNVKHEIRYARNHGLHYVIGYNLPTSDLDLIEEKLEGTEFNKIRRNVKAILYEYINFESYIALAKIIEEIDEIRRAQTVTRKIFTERFSPKIVAKRYLSAYENEDQELLNFCRNMLSADKWDADICLNDRSDENDYREHLVPCICLHNEIINQLEKGCKLRDLARLIQSHLAILHIPTNDAYILDHELKLKTRMPRGWTWGEDIFARIKELEKYKSDPDKYVEPY